MVSVDEREAGLRSILNFGHTFGHAIETLSGYGHFKHGEAVSMGMALAGDLSEALGACAPGVSGRIRGLLKDFDLPVEAPDIPASSMIETMKLDKKVSGERMRFVLVKKIGEVFYL